MKIGVVFPQTEFGIDPIALRDYTQTIETLGFTHVLAYDHVLGANPDRPGGWRGPYTYKHSFFEPFVLFSYMAGISKTLGFITGILILPQRETALVAKQAATLDLLCQGRFRMGIGVGWNPIEYTALKQDFHTRGKRSEAQIMLLRKLWTAPLVTHVDQWHNIPDAGLNPLPYQKPIPIWLGGYANTVLRRVAKVGDGWLPEHKDPVQAQVDLEKLKLYLEEEGRPQESIGLEARIHYEDGNPDRLNQLMEGWKKAGATHISVNTMGCGFKTPAAHLEALTRFAAQTMVR